MTLTSAPSDEAVTAAAVRHDLVIALTDAAVYLETHPGARLPQSPVINVRVKGASRAEKLTDLRAIADSWGAPVLTLPDGTLYAERVFGPLTFEAHVAPEYAGTTAYLEAARARKAVAA